MTQETIIAELVAGFIGLAGLLGMLFKWLINSVSQKLDRAVDAIEKLSESVSLIAQGQQQARADIAELKASNTTLRSDKSIR